MNVMLVGSGGSFPRSPCPPRRVKASPPRSVKASPPRTVKASPPRKAKKQRKRVTPIPKLSTPRHKPSKPSSSSGPSSPVMRFVQRKLLSVQQQMNPLKTNNGGHCATPISSLYKDFLSLPTNGYMGEKRKNRRRKYGIDMDHEKEEIIGELYEINFNKVLEEAFGI